MRRHKDTSSSEPKRKPTMDVGKLLDSFRKFAEQEKREDKRKSRAGTLASTGTSTSGRSAMRSGSLASDEDSILKRGMLKKQGGRVKSWHSRLFLLRRSGLYYFKDEDSYDRMDPPLGRILFCDMVSLTGNNLVAESLPLTIHVMLGLKYVFCVHTDTRTYTIAAPSREGQSAWVDEVNRAFHLFQSERRRKDALMQEVWRVGDDEVFNLASQLTKGESDVEVVLDQMLDTISEQFAEEVGKLHARRNVHRTFHAWKSYYRFCKIANEDGTEYAQPDHRGFFSGKGNLKTLLTGLGIGKHKK